MQKDKRKEIVKTLGKAKWLLGIGMLVIVVMPFLLTCSFFHQRFNFTETGQIGDTIGGITAPFLNLISAGLVFYALKAQVDANLQIQSQIDSENDARECDNEAQNLNQLYGYLNESITNFRFTTLPLEELKNYEETEEVVEYLGGEAFYHLFYQISCQYHGTQEQLHKTQAVSELLSVLKIMDLTLDKLATSKGKNKEILTTLVKHLFEYKIITRIREDKEEDLNLRFCESCECNHGLPEELKQLILGIQRKLAKPQTIQP